MIHPSKITKWPTIEAAEARGWVRPREAWLELRDGLRVVDVSGVDSYGYTYGIVNADDYGEKAVLLVSTDIWLSETENKIGRIGAFTPMFHKRYLRRLKPSVGGKLHVERERLEHFERRLSATRKRVQELEALWCGEKKQGDRAIDTAPTGHNNEGEVLWKA